MRKVAIYGIGANFGGIDVSKNFLHSGVAGVGWDQADAPDLHNYIDSIEKGDIIYIKSCNFGNDICVKGIGIVTDNASVGTFNIGSKYPINRGKTGRLAGQEYVRNSQAVRKKQCPLELRLPGISSGCHKRDSETDSIRDQWR